MWSPSTPHSWERTGTAWKTIEGFFMTDCAGKLQVLKKYNVDYVFVRGEDAQDCLGLKLIYRERALISMR